MHSARDLKQKEQQTMVVTPRADRKGEVSKSLNFVQKQLNTHTTIQKTAPG